MEKKEKRMKGERKGQEKTLTLHVHHVCTCIYFAVL